MPKPLNKEKIKDKNVALRNEFDSNWWPKYGNDKVMEVWQQRYGEFMDNEDQENQENPNCQLDNHSVIEEPKDAQEDVINNKQDDITLDNSVVASDDVNVDGCQADWD